jgi:hypothetical protein
VKNRIPGTPGRHNLQPPERICSAWPVVRSLPGACRNCTAAKPSSRNWLTLDLLETQIEAEEERLEVIMKVGAEAIY